MFRVREKQGDLSGRSHPLAGGDVTNLADDPVTQRVLLLFLPRTLKIWSEQNKQEDFSHSWCVRCDRCLSVLGFSFGLIAKKTACI